MSTEEARKRKYPRMTCKQANAGEGNYPFNHVVANISRQGCFIETDERFEIGDRFELVIHYPPRQEPMVREGEILWELKGKKGRGSKKTVHGYGVRFLSDDVASAAAMVDALLYFKVNRVI